ncbi:hypothetical protein G7085_14125 [Tessaracoccus sp. HDW20]|uniref:hypothetical protein n=1 Tax=Tessaracoccus coleopterorum TaxID=2714950 RepID=UPI0018D4A8D9|nr:hypothetical protein [Tessaracoccus coleopterorum]NHB85373.1 hypothetical protein [Tessaracoccus coleopterorum]
MAYPVTWYGPGTWAVALVVACWAVYYAVRPITWRTAAVQLASVWVGLTPVVAAADGVAPDSTTWSAFGAASPTAPGTSSSGWRRSP